jgi:uncharacterized membrane-anchored protein
MTIIIIISSTSRNIKKKKEKKERKETFMSKNIEKETKIKMCINNYITKKSKLIVSTTTTTTTTTKKQHIINYAYDENDDHFKERRTAMRRISNNILNEKQKI